MKQILIIFLTILSLTSYSQGKYPITVSGSGSGGAADSSVFATKYFVDTAKSNLRNSIALKMAYTDTAVMLAAYRTKIQTNIDSISVHNTRIGSVTTSNAGKLNSSNFNDSLAAGFRISDSSLSGNTTHNPSQINWNLISKQRYFEPIDNNFINYASTFETQDTANLSTVSGATPSFTDGKLSITGTSLISTRTFPNVPFFAIELDISNIGTSSSASSIKIGPALVKDAANYFVGYYDQITNVFAIMRNGSVLATTTATLGSVNPNNLILYLVLQGTTLSLWSKNNGTLIQRTNVLNTADFTVTGSLNTYRYGIYSSQSENVPVTLNSLRAGTSGGIAIFNTRIVTNDDGSPYIVDNKILFTGDVSATTAQPFVGYVDVNSTVFQMDLDNFSFQTVGHIYIQTTYCDNVDRTIAAQDMKLRWFPQRKQWLLTTTFASCPSGSWRMNDNYAWLDYSTPFGENIVPQTQLNKLGIDTTANPNLSYDINVRYDRNNSNYYVLASYTNTARGVAWTNVMPRMYYGTSMSALNTRVTADTTAFFELGSWAKLRGQWYALYWGFGQWKGIVKSFPSMSTLGTLSLPSSAASTFIPGFDYATYQKNGKTNYLLIGFDTTDAKIPTSAVSNGHGNLVIYKSDTTSTGYEFSNTIQNQIPVTISTPKKYYLNNRYYGTIGYNYFGVDNAAISQNSNYTGSVWQNTFKGSAHLLYFANAETQFRIRASQNAATSFSNDSVQFKVNAVNGTTAMGGNISPTAGTYTGAMVIANSTGLGINTTPSYLFHIKKDQAAETFMEIENANTSSGSGTAIVFKNSSAVNAKMGYYGTGTSFNAIGAGNLYYYYDATSGGITFVSAGASGYINWATGGSSEKMRLDPNGRLGIGFAAPTAALHLKSGTTAAGSAPVKLANVNPVLNTTPEKYAVEVDSATNGGKIYYTSADAVRNEIQLAAYGELYEDGGSTAITVTTAGTYYQWTTSTVGSSLLCTNSAATDNITVASGGGGTYLVNASVSFVGTNSATQKWAVFKNGSRLTNLTSVVHMAGSALQITTSLTGLVALAATDTIDLRVTSDTNGDIATPAQVNLNITRLSK